MSGPADPTNNVSGAAALTRSGWLIIWSLDRGEPLKRVYVSKRLKFRYATWERDNERLLLRSARGGSNDDVVVSLALLTIAPLKLVAVAPIRRSVYGRDVVNATINNGLLVVYRHSGNVDFYDFDSFYESHTIVLADIDETLSPADRVNVDYDYEVAMVGVEPLGFPYTIDSTARPTLLRTLRSQHDHIAFGAVPWHYIANTDRRERHAFHLRALDSDDLVEVFYKDDFNAEDDCAFFHPDFGNGVLHVGSGVVTCHDVADDGRLTKRFQINIKEKTPSSSFRWSDVATTSSGRVVKRRSVATYEYSLATLIHSIEYEDELDLFVVTAGFYEGDRARGHVLLCDKDSGCVVKRVVLDDWNDAVDANHRVFLDRDTLVHLFRKGPGREYCSVYTLVWRSDKNKSSRRETSSSK